MHDSESDPHGGEGIHPLTAASRPDEVWPSGGRTGPEDFPLLQNTSCLLFSCNVTARSLLPCHTLTCTICYFCVALCAHRLHSWLSGPLPSLGPAPQKQNNHSTVQHMLVFIFEWWSPWGEIWARTTIISDKLMCRRDGLMSSVSAERFAENRRGEWKEAREARVISKTHRHLTFSNEPNQTLDEYR